jgi:FkbM family methyltransferase
MIRRLLDGLFYRLYRLRWRWRAWHRRYVERTRPCDRPAGSSLYLLRLPTAGRPARFALERPGHIEDLLIEKGAYEPYITSLLLFLMREDGLFVDVGANFGLHALQIAGALPRARCLCFEPHPAVHEGLRRNIRFSGFDNVAAHALALGDAPGTVDFFMHDGAAYNRGLSSLQATPDMEAGFRRERVEMTTLDAFLPEADRERLSVVKIDVQGAERRVLAGMKDLLARARPAVVFEFESDYATDPRSEIRAILDTLPDHRVFQIRPGHPELEDFNPDAVGAKGYWVNLVALPKDAWPKLK